MKELNFKIQLKNDMDIIFQVLLINTIIEIILTSNVSEATFSINKRRLSLQK